jgi:hypothetical protein
MTRLLLVAAAWLFTAGIAQADPAGGAAPADNATNATPASSAASPTNSAASATTSTSSATSPSSGAATSEGGARPKGGFQTIDIPAPPAGKGEVVFFRKSAFQGSAVWFNVRENGEALGKLTNGVYFVAVEDPGAHAFTAATENKDTLKLEVDPGEIYYVEGRITMGMFVGEANLSPSDDATFQKDANHLKLAAQPASEKTTSASSKP